MHGWAKPIYLDADKLQYYPLVVSVNEYGGSCNTIEEPFGRICAPNKIENVNLTTFNMIKETNESKTLVKHISRECRCELDRRKCNSRQKWDNNKCQNEYEKPCVAKASDRIKHRSCEENYA